MAVSELMPVIVVAGIALLMAAHRHVYSSAQPLRLEMAKKGEEFLAKDDVPEQLKANMRFMLNSAFGMRIFLIVSLLAIPCAMLAMVLIPGSFKDYFQNIEKLDIQTKALRYDVLRLHFRIIFANHPILTSLINIEMALLIPLAVLGFSLAKSRIPPTQSDTIFTLIEVQHSTKHRSLLTT